MRKSFLDNDIWVTNVTMLIVLVGILIFTIVDIKKKQSIKEQRSFRAINTIALTSFIVYIFVILYATLLGRVELGYYKHMFNPLDTYIGAIKGSRKAIYDSIQNVIFFIPFGIYLFYFGFPKFRWYHALLLSALFSTCIEITQLLTQLGCSQTADVMNNALGGLLGYLLAHLIDFGISKQD